jgi:hypothetical protein
MLVVWLKNIRESGCFFMGEFLDDDEIFINI